MRLLFLMFVTAVCALFLLKLRWLFWSEIGSGFGEPRGTAPPRIPRSTPRTNLKERVDGCPLPSPCAAFSQFLLVNYNKKKQSWFYSRKYIHFLPIFLAWENSRHLAKLPLVPPPPPKWRLRNERRNSILMTRHNPHLGSASDWSCRVGNLIQPIRSTAQVWVVTRHQYGISALVSQTSFGGETSGSFAKCRLFSKAKIFWRSFFRVLHTTS